MNKNIWVKPEVKFIQFEANEFVSACNARFTADLYCGLPNNPTKMDGYTDYSSCGNSATHVNGGNCPNNNGKCDSYLDSTGHFHGFCADGEIDRVIEHGVWTGNTSGHSIWDVQVGQQITNYNSSTFTYNFANGIGSLIDNLQSAGWYLVSWLQGAYPGENNPYQHFGVAYIDNITKTGSPNRS